MKKNILVMNEKNGKSQLRNRRYKKEPNPGHLAQKVIFSMFKLELPYY